MKLNPEVKALRKEIRHFRGLTQALNSSLLEAWRHEELARIGIYKLMMEERIEKVLTEREATVIKMRFGFEDGIPKDLQTVGKAIGVTRERVRQIEAKAMMKFQYLDFPV